MRSSRPTLSKNWSFEIRRTRFLNYIKVADLLIARLWNCKKAGRVISKNIIVVIMKVIIWFMAAPWLHILFLKKYTDPSCRGFSALKSVGWRFWTTEKSVVNGSWGCEVFGRVFTLSLAAIVTRYNLVMNDDLLFPARLNFATGRAREKRRRCENENPERCFKTFSWFEGKSEQEIQIYVWRGKIHLIFSSQIKNCFETPFWVIFHVSFSFLWWELYVRIYICISDCHHSK